MGQAEHNGGIKTTGTIFDILETLMADDRMTVTELAEQVDVSKGTVHAHLQTLKDRGYLVQTDDKAYRLGLRFLAMGGHVRDSTYKRLYRNCKPELDNLAEETGERVQVMVEEAGYGVYLYQAMGNEAVVTDSYVGKRITLHATAAGKAYLAHLPEAEVERILDTVGLPAHTESTITEREKLYGRLETVGSNGVAYDRGERVEGIRCIAVPIESDDDEVLGALSVSSPIQRMKQSGFEEELKERMKNSARIIGLNTTYA